MPWPVSLAALAMAVVPCSALPSGSAPPARESPTMTNQPDTTTEPKPGPSGRTRHPGRAATELWVLALCDMRTLYLRNVPDEVAERLERMAAAAGTSVNSIAIRELAASSRRVDNAALLAALEDRPVDVDQIVSDLDVGRSER